MFMDPSTFPGNSRRRVPWWFPALSPVSQKTARFAIPTRIIPGLAEKLFANFVKGVWTALPDFSIELLNAGEIEPGVVAHRWLIRATHTGPGAGGSEPTGRTVSFKGASIIHIERDKIRSDQCYCDLNPLDGGTDHAWSLTSGLFPQQSATPLISPL
jgi:hypothetical protein